MNDKNDWQELIDRHLHGQLDESEKERLAELLDSSAAARREFVEYARWDTEMAEALRERGHSYQDMDSLALNQPTTGRQRWSTPVADTDKPVRHSSPPIGTWASGIATLVAICLLALFILHMPPQQLASAYPSLGDLTIAVSRSEQSIWSAAADGDLRAIRTELENHVSANAKSECGLAPLHVATLFNQPRAVELLLSNGANISLTDGKGNTPLHMAAFLGHTDVVRVLLEAGADAAFRNDLGFNASDLVAITWSSGLEKYYHGIEEELNASLNLEQIRAERPKILRLLSTANNAPVDRAPSISIWQAAITGNTAAVKQHIAAGTDINAKEDFGGSTPLILSAIFGQPEIARILIEAGADLELRNYSGGTALHLASFFCQPALVDLLLDSGADLHKANGHGLTPLGVVTGEWNAELEGIYEHIYGSLNLPFDSEHVRKARHQVAESLKRHEAAERNEVGGTQE